MTWTANDNRKLLALRRKVWSLLANREVSITDSEVALLRKGLREMQAQKHPIPQDLKDAAVRLGLTDERKMK